MTDELRQEPGGAAWSPVRVRVVALGLVLLHTVLVVYLMGAVGRTIDEPAYLNSGRLVLRGDWSHVPTRLHGPLPFYFNQLAIGEFPPGGIWSAEDPGRVLFRSRLGMLPFAWLLAAIVFLWSRRLFGPAGGLLSLAVHVLNPMMLAYASLVAVDTAHCALVVAALFAVWCFLQAPGAGRGSLLRAGGVGLVLGLAFATKYLALFIGPIVVLAVALRLLLRDRSARGLLLATGAAVACTAATFLALHAAYGFRVGFAPGDPAAYESGLVSGLVRVPGVGLFLRAFPEPYLLGVDFQAAVGEEPHLSPYLNGRFAPVHHAYYLWCFLLKTPDWELVAVGLLLALLLPRWLAGRGTPGQRRAAWLVVAAVGVTWPYLSTSTGLQIGIRYVLPTYPLLFVLLGGWTTSARLTRLPPSGIAGLLLGLSVWTAWDLGRQWPDLIGYYNLLAGGQAHAYEHFKDSNSNWGSLLDEGLDELRETEREPFEVLTAISGPRLGRVVIDVRDLVHADPEDPSRFRHWLQAVEPPVRHVGATWFLFDASEERWRAHLERSDDPRRRLELAHALLGAGRREDARALAAELPPELASELAELERLTDVGPGSTDAAWLEAVSAWSLRARRNDLAEALLRERPALVEARPNLLALIQSKRGHVEEAIATLEASDLAADPKRPMLLSMLQLSEDHREEALACLEQAARDFPGSAPVQAELERVRELARAKRAFLQALGAP